MSGKGGNDKGSGGIPVPVRQSPLDAYRRSCQILAPERGGYDVTIASREIEGARCYNEPANCHLMGRVFNLIVRLLAVRGIQDSGWLQVIPT